MRLNFNFYCLQLGISQLFVIQKPILTNYINENTMTLEQLKQICDKEFGFDIKQKTRKRHAVYAKKVFCKLAKDLEAYPLETIGNKICTDHSNALYHIKTYEHIYTYHKRIFNKIIESYELKSEKFNLEPVIKKPIKTKLEGVLRDFNVLLELSNEDIEEFKETRLKPFMLMKRKK